MAIGEIGLFPYTDWRTLLPGAGGEEAGLPLSPEPRAVLRREHCLGLLNYGI